MINFAKMLGFSYKILKKDLQRSDLILRLIVLIILKFILILLIMKIILIILVISLSSQMFLN